MVVNKQGCIDILDEVLRNRKAVEEFNLEGFGKEIVESLDENGYYPVFELFRWEYVMRNNWEALEALGKD